MGAVSPDLAHAILQRRKAPVFERFPRRVLFDDPRDYNFILSGKMRVRDAYLFFEASE